MTELTRSQLELVYTNGARPDEQNFADLFDSFLNKLDDGLRVENAENDLVLPGGLGLADSNRAQPGTLRLRSGRVQFHDGVDWVTLGSGGGAFRGVGGGTAVAYADGNVGIGAPFANTAPTFRLEVELAANSGEGERVRFGTVVCSNGSASADDAYVYQRNQDPTNGYALRQRQGGEVRLNAPAGQRIRLTQNDDAGSRLCITTDGNVVINSANNLTAGSVFQVNGQAFKNTPGNWITPSDARLKEEVRDLEAGLEQLRAVRPVRFRFNGKAGTPRGQQGVGIIGQEMERVLPEMVQHVAAKLDDDSEIADLRLYNDSALTYVLVNAVKELAAKVDKLEAALERGAAGDDDR